MCLPQRISKVAALSDDVPLVRGHAAWALGRIASPAALDRLRAHAEVETDTWVLEEIATALESVQLGDRA